MYYSRAIHYYHESMIQINVIWYMHRRDSRAQAEVRLAKIADILIYDILNVVVFIHNKLW